MRHAVCVAIVGGLLGLGVNAAHAADPITVGLYAPASPFGSTSDRLGYITALAQHVESVADGREVVGRVYARASQLTAAIKSGEVQFAVIDAGYAAARGLPYEILGAAVRNGSSTGIWQLVAGSGVRSLGDLAGKIIAAPRIGARDTAFVTNVLLGGEVDDAYFKSITFAPNPNSAATMVSLGRADAALVPVGTTLPSGVLPILNAGTVGWPMLVAMPNTDKTLVEAVRDAIGSFGHSTFSSFAAPAAGEYSSLESRFGRAKKHGVMTAVEPARLDVAPILAGRAFTITPTDLASLVVAPPETGN